MAEPGAPQGTWRIVVLASPLLCLVDLPGIAIAFSSSDGWTFWYVLAAADLAWAGIVLVLARASRVGGWSRIVMALSAAAWALACQYLFIAWMFS